MIDFEERARRIAASPAFDEDPTQRYKLNEYGEGLRADMEATKELVFSTGMPFERFTDAVVGRMAVAVFEEIRLARAAEELVNAAKDPTAGDL